MSSPSYPRSYTSSYESRICPPQGSPESELLAYRDRVINRWSIYRNSHMGRIGLAMSYFLGHQWAELDYEAVFDGVRGVAIRNALAEGDIDPVRPVTNEIDPATEAEMIALVKRRWTPKFTATSKDPRMKAAAQVADDQLNYRLEQIGWREKRHQLGLHFPIGGTGLIYTAWDKPYSDLRPTGSPTAVICDGCGTALYSRVVPAETLRLGVPDGEGGRKPVSLLETARPVSPDEIDMEGGGEELARLEYCPSCPEPHPLTPLDVTPDMYDDLDVFGRPLSVDEPRGGTALEIDLPYEFFPQNGGARVQPVSMRRWARRKIRDMSWIEERYPHLVHLVSPDNVSELLYGDPLLGDRESLESWSPAYDSGIFDDHANVDEVVEQPSFREPLGRYIVCAKDVVLEDGPLLESSKLEDIDGQTRDVFVARVNMSISRFKLRPGELWGTTIADHEISKQNRLNGLDAQVISTRLRMGPHVVLPADMWPQEGVNLESVDGVGTFIFTQPSPQSQNAKPEVVQGTLMPEAVYLERDRIQADIKRSIGPQNASLGMGERNVGTTSGIQLLIDQDDRSRSLREDELVNSAERSWSHLSQLEWVLRVDEDVYRVLGPDKSWKYEQYKGAALRGQCEVKIERGSFIAKSVVNREGAREALADGVVVIDSPMARRRMAELYGLDTDINADTTNQVDHAERVWVNFVDKDLIPVQDPIDEPEIHHAVLEAHLRTEEGERIAEAAGWDGILRTTAGWEDELRRVVVLEAKSIAFYGQRLKGDEAKVAYAKAVIAYQAQQDMFERQRTIVASYEQQQQQLAAISGGNPNANAGAMTVPPVLGEPPVPPPPPVDIPVLMQDRILFVWESMMKKEGKSLIGTPPPTPRPVDAALNPSQEEQGTPSRDPSSYAKFRALVMSYRMSAGMAMASALPSPGGTGATMAPVDKGSPASALPPENAVPGAPGKVTRPGQPTTNATPGGGKH